MQYEDLIKKISGIEPVPDNPSLLTDNILYSIEESDSRRHFIFLKANQRQWLVFNGIRTMLTSAAIFLIGFFLYQQWEISFKIRKLEEHVAQSGMIYQSDPGNADEIHTILLNAGLTIEKDSVNSGILQINRRSLNYLRGRIDELEKENLNIRDMLKQYYNDSTELTRKTQKQ